MRSPLARPSAPSSTAVGPRRASLLAAALVAVAALAVVVTGLVTLSAPQAAAAQGRLCGETDVAPTDGGAYAVQNNRYGVPGGQCVTAHDGGFTVDQADGARPPGGAPKSYPSMVAGCHWGRCTDAPGLPVRASEIGDARTAVSITRAPGSWNASYDIWFDHAQAPQGQNDGTELMIWIDGEDAPDPIGEVVAAVTIAGAAWDVWQGDIGWHVISFVRQRGATSVDLPLAPFVAEAVERGATEPEWWMTSVQMGFEPWSGGAGLAVDGFSWTPPSGAAAPVGTEDDEDAAAGAAPAAAAGTLVRQTGSGACLDGRGTGEAGDPQVALWDCDASQTWTLTEDDDLVHDDTGACLGPVGGDTASGTPVQLQVCDHLDVQEWGRSGDELVNTASRLCLTAERGAQADGTAIVLGRCSGAGALEAP